MQLLVFGKLAFKDGCKGEGNRAVTEVTDTNIRFNYAQITGKPKLKN